MSDDGKTTILRIKGKLLTAEGWVMVQGVRDIFDITEIKDKDSTFTQHLVFIGIHLDTQRLANLTNMTLS